MKLHKLYFSFLFLLVTTIFYAQNGIAYQAVIFKPGAKSLPGVSASSTPLANTKVCLRFTFNDISNKSEYQETVTVTTDDYGIVNTTIGLGNQIGGYAKNFSEVSWRTEQKTLVVELDLTANCSTYEEISRQSFSSTPYAFTANNISGIASIANGGTGASTAAEALDNLGAQRVSNLSTDINGDGASIVKYPAVKTVKEYVDAKMATSGSDATATATGKIQLAGDLAGVGSTATSPVISNLAITATKLSSDAVVTTKIKDGNVTTVKIADGAITDSKIATGISASKVGLGNVDNTSDANKPLSTATTQQLAIKEDLSNKVTDFTANSTSDIKYPSVKAIKTYVDSKVAGVTTNGAVDADSTTKGLIQLAGDFSGTADAPTVTNAAVIGKQLTGFTSSAGAILATDTVLGALQKVDGNVALKAPLDSPVFTGIPVAPTANANTISEQLATTAFVSNAVANANSAGLLPPSMSTVERDAISNPAKGLQIYCTDCSPEGLYSYNGTAWTSISAIDTFLTDILVHEITVGRGSGTGQYNTALGFTSLLYNTTGESNTALGDKTLRNNIIGSNNSAIGDLALANNIEGNNNTALGAQSLSYNIDGSNNTAIGKETLKANTTGNNNSALGAQSLFSNIDGNNNTAIGIETLKANTTGSNNTALGAQSLFSNIDGSNNTALGIETLKANTTGSNNTALGAQSLSTNIDGSNNTAIGIETLKANTTGYNNTALGAQSLSSNIDGSNNTAIGIETLKANTMGFSNTALGAQSLFSNIGGDNNTAVGKETLRTNTTGNNNTALGAQSLFLNTEGNNNTAIGIETLKANTAGSNNTALGAQSLYSNTEGNNNTAIGIETLKANTTGYNNTALGAQSLSSNIDGSNNTAIGIETLKANTTGSNNTALGAQSLYSNIDGSNDTAIGTATLNANTTGSYNSAIGTDALSHNTTGSYNTTLGAASLSSNTEGNYNTALGYSTLRFNTTGSSNTAIGMESLKFNTTGFLNTALGYSSLQANSEGYSNTALGYGSLLSNVNGSDNIALGVFSLNTNTTGANNIAVGNNSLFSNTEGISNTAIGRYSLYLTTGTNNTALGDQSLSDNVAGNSNISLGFKSGKGFTSGEKNIFIGSQTAGTGMTSGDYNTIIGSDITGLPTTLNNNIILADGAGNIRAQHDGTAWDLKTTIKGVTELASDTSTKLASTAFVANAVTTAATPDATTTATGKILLAGDLSGTADAPTVTNAAVIGKVLTGFVSASGTVSATDSVLEAIQKVDGNVALKAPLASPTFTGTATAPTFTATAVTGAAPFVVASTTPVANLSIGGNAATATNATTTTNIAAGALGAVPYQSGVGTTTFLAGNTTSTPKFLTSTGTGTIANAPTWTDFSGVAVPYTGATAAVDLGAYDLKVNGITVGVGKSNVSSNIAMGELALSSNTTGGINNSALGKYALKSNTSGYSNIALGNSALFLNTDGNENIAIGLSALNDTSTGSDSNIAMGYYAFKNLLNSDKNIGIGKLVGYGFTTGESNIFIGNGTTTNNGLTSGSNNTIIGSNFTGLPATLNNNIILADGAGNIRARYDNGWTFGSFTLPTSGTFATLDGTETLTNKTLTSPILGEAIATSVNKVTITQPATNATLTIADGKTLTANNSISLTGTDSTTMTFPSTTATIARTDAAQTFTGTQSFSSPISGSITGNAGTATSIAGGTLGAVPYQSAAGTTNFLAGNTTSTSKFLTSTGDGTTAAAPTWTNFDAIAVPYTGATGAVDLGSYDLKVNGLTVGTGKNGGTVTISNTALGKNALSANNSGSGGNTAIGKEALMLNATGYYNTAIGDSNLLNNTSGIYNTAIGFKTMVFSPSGTHNTSLGALSLYSISTGTKNIGIGYQAGRGFMTGTSNIFLGNTSGSLVTDYTGITTGSYNTIIGSEIKNLASGLSNNIILADGAGNIRAQHDGTAWNLKTTVKGVTETAGDNSTNLASTAFVTTAVANAVKPAASFSINSAQSIDNAGGEYVVLLKNTNFTNMTTPSLINQNNNFVAPKAGIYQVNGLITFNSVDTTCQSNFKCLIYKNLNTSGSFSYDYDTTTGVGTGKFSSDPTSDSATIYKSGMPGSSSSSNMSCLIELAAGDTLLFGFHVDVCALGSGMQLSANPSKTYFDVNFVSALP